MNGILLSPKSAERHKLTLSTDKSQCTLFDRRIEGNSVALKSIQIGGTRLENLTATVADPNQISHTGVNIEQAPVGWLGTPLLSQFQVTFRFAIHSVTFEDAKAPLPKTAETTLIPFTLKEGRIMIKAEIEGAKPFSAILDTGTPGVLIPASVGATLRTTGQKLLSIRHASGTKGQAIQNRAPVLRVGDTELRGIGVVYISPDSPAEFDRNFAVLGMSFLRYFKVTINYAKQRIALTPVTADTGEAQP
jgi:predicted aspartyl protease